jgi:hypothetical protein
MEGSTHGCVIPVKRRGLILSRQKYIDRFTDVLEFYTGQSEIVREERVLELYTIIEKMVWKHRGDLKPPEAKSLAREAFIRLVTMAKAESRSSELRV